MPSPYRQRRVIVLLITAVISLAVGSWLTDGPHMAEVIDAIRAQVPSLQQSSPPPAANSAMAALQGLPVKGRAAKTGYARTQFSNGWQQVAGCDERNNILRRDLRHVVSDADCHVISGILDDPYTGKTIYFKRGPGSSARVQIDHVVALSNAWQTGAQQLSYQQRQALANDPLELLAVDGTANQQKSDGDAATWLPAYKPFRCQYVARQIAIKQKYALWVTPPEKQAMQHVLHSCPTQKLPVP